MKGYSKMQLIDSPTSTKSRSIDFSDLNSIPISIKTSKFTPKSKPSTIADPTNSISEYDDHGNKHEEQLEEDNSFQNAASSINPDTGFNREKKNSNKLQATVKRAFSMRRSSSISEKYCRIHDHSLNLQTQYEDEEEESQVKGSENKKGSVLKACKRIFRI
ncbi:hypothetical protein L2E82_24691 [Cichorium intybus]|uniref:Uncharacterized protein n=1 Tax=Cichorium intybus TaxID=13427 RepID=A0ACB9E1L7_CICIN|nr:hypothetical protein L2E82_24691 [Cichorium intybus]